ncbi:hypothetical protein FA15DRAFT_695580 [Coprinopsis marcescibilis]|uniref:Secreted protein n=1 Tax=Coprinopsis marcescibilis TaxID=230819 RepID=A0A5C3KQ63_COPMA|nr:hypothetical protein FA15DRAFT_695580 [Coprinopsis marcescibilis]
MFTDLRSIPGILILLCIVTSASPQHFRPSHGLKLTRASLAGNGCPPMTTYYFLNPLKPEITVNYSDLYPGRRGPGTIPRQRCNLEFDVSLPDGVALTLSSVDYEGNYVLDKGDSITRITSFSFQNPSTLSATTRGVISGPFGRPWDWDTFRDEFDPATAVTSGCGGQPTLNISINLNPFGRFENLRDDIEDMSMVTVFTLKLSESCGPYSTAASQPVLHPL